MTEWWDGLGEQERAMWAMVALYGVFLAILLAGKAVASMLREARGA